MIRVADEADNAPWIEITPKALEHIKGTERWLGFLMGVVVGISAAFGFFLLAR